MRNKAFVFLAVAAMVTALVLPASADMDPGTGTVTATLSTTETVGTRSVTLVSVAPLALQTGTATMTGAVAISVTELARTGTASWYVAAVLDEVGASGSNNGLTDGGTSATYISRNQLSIAGGVPSLLGAPTVGGGGSATAGGGGTLSTARTLYTITGQDPGLVYTGVYTSSHLITLTIPNGQKLGVYTGTLRVTLHS